MGVNKLSLKFIRRQGTNIGEDILDFVGGVNILVGEGNTGKTKWLESIDYILGDDPSAEQREEDDIFKIYDSILQPTLPSERKSYCRETMERAGRTRQGVRERRAH